MLRVEYNDPDLTLDDRPTNWGGEYICIKANPLLV